MGHPTEDLLSFASGVVSSDLLRLLKPTESSGFTSCLKLKSPSLPSLALSSRSLLDDAANDLDALFDAVTDIAHFGSLHFTNGEQWYFDDEHDEYDGLAPRDRKSRAPNRFPYVFGDLATAAWHTKFLADGEVRRKTEMLSLDRTSTFRGEFRLPLYKIEYLVSLFRERRWIDFSHHCRTEAKLKIKSELLILGALNVLAHGKTFRSLEVTTNISREEHRKFFHLFLDKMYSIRDDHIRLPTDKDELQEVMDEYAAKNLPGCAGSIDVVHVYWHCCPAGDLNTYKGKEKHPSFAFEVVSRSNRQVMGIATIQPGTRNDKHIVKLDHNVAAIRDKWYSAVEYPMFNSSGEVVVGRGVYFICDGG